MIHISVMIKNNSLVSTHVSLTARVRPRWGTCHRPRDADH